MTQDVIDDQVVEDFRKMLGLGAEEALPKRLLDVYYSYKYMKDLLGHTAISPAELVVIAMFSGMGKGDNGELKQGDHVTSVFNEKEVEGIFIKMEGDELCHMKVTGDNMKFRKVLLKDTKKVR